MDKVSKWFLPTVHLDDLHTIDNFTHQSDSLVSFPCSLYPESSKLLSHPCCRICWYVMTYCNNINILTLQRYKWDQENSSHQSTGTNLVAEDGCHNDQLQGTSPQVVVEKDSGVKPEIRENCFYWLKFEIFCFKANLLTSFERRFTICPMVVWPKAELESLRAFL